LSSDQERLVLQTLAVYGKPVPLAAIRFVLPALPIDEILDKLFRNLVISFDPAGKRYWLHPLDQKYAYKQIPDQGKDYSKTVLHGLAAQFYRSLLCPPRGSRTSIDDVGPMLDAIGHLMDAEQAEEAVALFLDTGIDEDLHWWGHYLILTGLYERFLKCKISPKKKIALHIRFGKVHRNLGDLEKAQEIYESALPIISEAADPESEIGLLNALGDIAYYRSRSKLDLTPALKYLRRARDLLALNPHPLLQSENAGDLANVMYSLDEYEEAQHLYEQAIVFSKEAGNRIYEGIWHGDLGNVHSELMMTGTDKSAHQELAISYFHRAIAIAKETNDRRHESHWNGNLGNCYLKVGEYELAKAHLREALLISVPIHYGRMIPAQMSWLIATFDQHIQQCIQNRDIAAALKVGQSILQAAGEIGNAELEREAKRCIEALAPKDILNIFLLFQKGQVKEAVAESRKILASSEGKDETWAALAAIAMHWGRQSGQKDIFCLAAEAYSKLIGVSPDRPRQAPFLERANAHALSGNLEDAIDDYDEAMKQEPQNACASLSRAEVQIWAGRYGEARLSLEALFPALKTRADQVIGAWLMCHALNLEGRDFSEYKQVLMRKTEEDIGLDYGVRDIEPYIKELGRAIFSEEQIQNAWMLQSLIKRFAELCRCQ
jgi:tetratricopeptide (TPR) repeat protein